MISKDLPVLILKNLVGIASVVRLLRKLHNPHFLHINQFIPEVRLQDRMKTRIIQIRLHLLGLKS